jgi:phospholipid/cholesterol/gamma-HCH transport system ATP-binding protein
VTKEPVTSAPATSATPARKTVIEVKGFRKSFGSKVVHRDVSFSLFEGECLGLIGGSGVGKSVILRGLIGLEKPDGGSIMVDGEPIEGLGEHAMQAIRLKVAYVFQNGALFDSMTVFENLAYPLREHASLSEREIAERIRELLAEFGLQGSEDAFPASLSGGMQKRVGLARAIILRPKIVLYDEPTAGLDPYNTKRIQEMALGLKAKGVASIIVTHDMPTAFAVCDRIALLADGRISSIGTRAELEREHGDRINKFISGEET